MKTRITLFVGIILCYVFPSFGQYYPDKALNDTAKYPYWQEMMQDPNANFYATVSAFNKYWENRTDYKGNGWKVFKRWEYINKDLVLPNGKLPGPDYFLKERQKYERTHNVRSASGNWTNIGPTAYPANATGQPTGLGRVNCFGFDPVSASTFYAGTPAGGIWKTTDNGASWTLLNEGMPTLGVSSILVNPNNGSEILIGTGDRDASDSYGFGVYKSTDGGLTWNASNSGMGNQTVGMMIRDPANANIILAATKNGIYKSTDGGANWGIKYGGGSNFMDIKFKPGDFNIVYATAYGSFYRSVDAGENWSPVTLPVSGYRLVIGVSANDPTFVYLLQTNGPFAGLLKSSDSGLTFSTQSTSPNIMDYACDGSGTGSQAFYDLCIAVDPNNANIIYAGGINVWKSTDGGVNWVISSHWIGRDYGTDCDVNAASVHADQHALQWSPLTSKLLLGNDGGVYYTVNGGTDWPQISAGLGIAQIYRLGQSASQNNLVTTGHQDNGTFIYDGTTFTTVKGGDGMDCIIDYSDANYRYGEAYQGSISRFVTSGSYYSIKNNINETGAWVTPYILHNSNSNTMFAGYKNVWRTTNVKAANSSNISWTAISTGETSTCDVIEQSLADVDILYASRGSALKRTDNANATTPSWTSCTSPSGSNITALETNENNANIVYASAGAKVYKSTDKGVNWTDISGTLPNININTVVYRKNSNEELYIGTKNGVFVKNAGMSDWIAFSTGLPVTDVRELEIYYDTEGTQDRLKAATYGRGLWQSDLVETGVLNPTNLTAVASSSTQIDLSWVLNPSGNNVLLAYGTSSTFGTPADGTSYTAGNTIAGGGTVLYNGSNTTFNHTLLSPNTQYFYKLWSYDGSKVYSGGTTDNETTKCKIITALPFTEDFEATTFPPTCWASFRGTNNLGVTQDWQRTTTNTYNSSAGTAYIQYENVSGGLAEDWLVTKQIALPNSGISTLTFYQKQTYTSNYGSTYSIKVSQTSQTSQASFTNVTTYDESTFGTSYTQKSVDLSAYNGQNVFIAFVMTNDDGDTWYIDDIKVDNTSNYWSGTTNTDWNTSGNWSAGSVPVGSDDIVIPDVINNPIVNEPTPSPATCNKLTIQLGGVLTINPGKALTANDTVYNNAGSAGLVIKSDATGTGSLIQNTANVDATVERYVSGYTSASDGWHLISSPVVNQSISGDWTPTGSVYDFYAFDESKTTENWLNQKVGANNITNFSPGKGYLVAYQVSGNRAFTGPLNSTNVTLSGLTNTGASAYAGWNLIGNPFASAIDYNSGTWTKTNIDVEMQVWNSADASYKTSTEVGGIIPAMNGFMVYTTGNGTLIIPLDSRTHNTTNWYKSDNGDFILLKANDLEGNTSQSSIVRFNTQATEAYDAKFDSYFLSGFAPMFYSRSGDDKLALNTLPEISNNFEIPFDFIKNSSTDFNIELAQTLPGVNLYLLDKKTNIESNLTKNPVYQFTSSEGDAYDRFILKFKTLGIDDHESTLISIYSYNSTISIRGFAKAKVRIINMLGQTIMTTSINGNGLSTIQAPGVAPGIYEVSVISDKRVVSRKVALGY